MTRSLGAFGAGWLFELYSLNFSLCAAFAILSAKEFHGSTYGVGVQKASLFSQSEPVPQCCLWSAVQPGLVFLTAAEALPVGGQPAVAILDVALFRGLLIF